MKFELDFLLDPKDYQFECRHIFWNFRRSLTLALIGVVSLLSIVIYVYRKKFVWLALLILADYVTFRFFKRLEDSIKSNMLLPYRDSDGQNWIHVCFFPDYFQYQISGKFFVSSYEQLTIEMRGDLAAVYFGKDKNKSQALCLKLNAFTVGKREEWETWIREKRFTEISQNAISERVPRPIQTPEYQFEGAISYDIMWNVLQMLTKRKGEDKTESFGIGVAILAVFLAFVKVCNTPIPLKWMDWVDWAGFFLIVMPLLWIIYDLLSSDKRRKRQLDQIFQDSPQNNTWYFYDEKCIVCNFNSRRVYQYKHLKKLVETKEAFVLVYYNQTSTICVIPKDWIPKGMREEWRAFMQEKLHKAVAFQHNRYEEENPYRIPRTEKKETSCPEFQITVQLSEKMLWEAFPALNPVSIEKRKGALFVVFAIAFCLFSMRRYMGQTDVKGQIILLIFCLAVIVFSLRSAYPFYRIRKTITKYLPFREPGRLLYFGKTECVEH